ncbi:GNAT family N-acetyltransferase [Tissierella sp.]|uniref:GNAT family N-acetyltransferase n=1 Tax=Tissierella sp. TaxID=41274 RepID=UPI0028562448|nr:GNAT family N-acetyltransferase [Tissierella sp.]MDR7857538.1 GNAT family N-acetyltransferase [Tissierella sp.]
MLNFRKYVKGDEESILHLFERSFDRKMSYDYWKWRYMDNPNIYENLINLALEDNIVGHYAVSPVPLFINAIKYNSALSMTTMIDPEYRGRGLFTNLAKDLINCTQELDLIFGVPNENSVKGFVEKLDFKLIKEIPMLESKSLSREYYFNSCCVYIEKFDERFNDLFTRCIDKYKIITTRKSEHLNWRFIDNPVNEYKTLAYIDDNKVLGYVVIKNYISNAITNGDIVDILAINDMVMRELLNASFYLFKDEGVSSINTWFHDKELLKIFEEFGFFPNGQYFHFIVRRISDLLEEMVFDFDNWYITMSDIDLF